MSINYIHAVDDWRRSSKSQIYWTQNNSAIHNRHRTRWSILTRHKYGADVLTVFYRKLSTGLDPSRERLVKLLAVDKPAGYLDKVSKSWLEYDTIFANKGFINFVRQKDYT